MRYTHNIGFVAILFLVAACGGGGGSNTSPSTETDDPTFGEFVDDLVNNESSEENEVEDEFDNEEALDDFLFVQLFKLNLDVFEERVEWLCGYSDTVTEEALNGGTIRYGGEGNLGRTHFFFPVPALGAFESSDPDILASARFTIASGDFSENTVIVDYPDIGAQDRWSDIEFDNPGDRMTFRFTSDVLQSAICIKTLP